MACLQLRVKTYVVISAILFIWIAVLAFLVTFANLSTNIIHETCFPFFVYTSYTVEKTLKSLNLLVFYILPLTCTVVCYSRIVYRLKTKVTWNKDDVAKFHFTHRIQEQSFFHCSSTRFGLDVCVVAFCFFLSLGLHYCIIIQLSMSSVLFFSRPRSEGWPHHGRTFSIYPCPLSF